MWAPFALASILQTQQGPPPTRFQLANPLPSLAPITIDTQLAYDGPTKLICKQYGLEGRILWIDATANVERYNTEEKIINLVAKIKESGFNTIVFDVKPLSSEMVYPSAFAPKLTEWRGKILGDFDPAGPMVREARRHGLQIYFSMNAFCDGHRLVNRGPGFDRKDEQSVVYEPKPIIRIRSLRFDIGPKADDRVVAIASEVPALPEAPPSAGGSQGAGGSQEGAPPVGDLVGPRVVAVCNKQGEIVEGNAVPKGGFVVLATGKAFENFKEIAQIGDRVTFDSDHRFVPISVSADKQYPLMTSPNHPVVRRRLRDLATEAMTKYRPDGLIYDDRLRYTGLNGDFSELTRSLFEQYVGKKLSWPEDVFTFTYSWNGGLVRGVKPGKFYDAWMAWRAGVLQSFAKEIKGLIRQISPAAKFGVYAGSWYGEYQSYGNNWASQASEMGFWFATPEYQKVGMADDLDFLITGCYYQQPTIFSAMASGRPIGATVESGGYLSYRAVNDSTFVYAGLSLADFKGDPVGLGDALQAAVATTNGVMVFDLSHDIEPMWPVFAKAFARPKAAPHALSKYIYEVKSLAAARKRQGIRPPTVVIAAGSSGVGF